MGKDFLRIKWKYELTVHFKHDMIGKWLGKHFTETSNKVELRINRVRINRVRPVMVKYIVSRLQRVRLQRVPIYKVHMSAHKNHWQQSCQC